MVRHVERQTAHRMASIPISGSADYGLGRGDLGASRPLPSTENPLERIAVSSSASAIRLGRYNWTMSRLSIWTYIGIAATPKAL
jgi:hypothetical protein